MTDPTIAMFFSTLLPLTVYTVKHLIFKSHCNVCHTSVKLAFINSNSIHLFHGFRLTQSHSFFFFSKISPLHGGHNSILFSED